MFQVSGTVQKAKRCRAQSEKEPTKAVHCLNGAQSTTCHPAYAGTLPLPLAWRGSRMDSASMSVIATDQRASALGWQPSAWEDEPASTILSSSKKKTSSNSSLSRGESMGTQTIGAQNGLCRPGGSGWLPRECFVLWFWTPWKSKLSGGPMDIHQDDATDILLQCAAQIKIWLHLIHRLEVSWTATIQSASITINLFRIPAIFLSLSLKATGDPTRCNDILGFVRVTRGISRCCNQAFLNSTMKINTIYSLVNSTAAMQ